MPKRQITMTIDLDEQTTVYTLPSQIDFDNKAQYSNALGAIIENMTNFKKVIDGKLFTNSYEQSKEQKLYRKKVK